MGDYHAYCLPLVIKDNKKYRADSISYDASMIENTNNYHEHCLPFAIQHNKKYATDSDGNSDDFSDDSTDDSVMDDYDDYCLPFVKEDNKKFAMDSNSFDSVTIESGKYDEDCVPLIMKENKKYGTDSSSSENVQYEELPPKSSPCLNFLCRCLPDWFAEEFTIVFNLSWSLFIISLFSFLMSPISLIFVGRLGTDQLAGVAMASTVLNVTGISIGTGLTTACDTVFSQSMGSANKSMVGVYLVKSLIIILLFVFPCWAIHLNVEQLLLMMGQEPVIAHIAGNYLKTFMPGLPFVFIVQILMQYLRCQDIIMPTMVIGAVGCGINAFGHYLLLIVLEQGTNGSALAMVFTFIAMAFMTIIYMAVTKIHLRTWKGWTMDILQDWGMFLKLAVAGMLMIGLEWGAFEIGIITSGLLGAVQLGATSLVFQIITIVYMCPLGIGLACNIRIGQLVGGNNIDMAKKTIKVGFLLCFLSATTIALCMVLLRSEIPKLFSDDPAVINYAATILPIAGLVEFFDGFAGVCGGILRGCGRQVIGTVVLMLGYYGLGLPVGLPLMFLTEIEVPGFYWGLVIGVTISSILFIIIVRRTDWPQMIINARMRTGTMEFDDDQDNKLPVNQRVRRVSESKRSRGSCTSTSRLAIPVEFHPSIPSTPRMLLMKRFLFTLIMVLTFFVGLFFHLNYTPPQFIPTTTDIATLVTNVTTIDVSSTMTPI